MRHPNKSNLSSKDRHWNGRGCGAPWRRLAGKPLAKPANAATDAATKQNRTAPWKCSRHHRIQQSRCHCLEQHRSCRCLLQQHHCCRRRLRQCCCRVTAEDSTAATIDNVAAHNAAGGGGSKATTTVDNSQNTKLKWSHGIIFLIQSCGSSSHIKRPAHNFSDTKMGHR